MRYLPIYRLMVGLIPAPQKSWRLASGDDRAGFARQAADIYRAHRCKGAALGLFDAGGLHTHLVYGKARSKTPVEENTAFRTASVSKMVTAALAMKLAEAGKIRLDQDLEGVLPYSLRHPRARQLPITLKMLLSHTAGIRDGRAYLAALGQEVPAEELLQQDSHTDHLPGEGCEYSNFGVGLSACALEAALDTSFEALAQTWLFEPLGMSASFYPHRIRAPLANAWRVWPPKRKPAFDGKARQQSVKEGWDLPQPGKHYSLAQGNCCMDVQSAARLGQALMSPGFLSEESLLAMRAPAASLSHRDPALTQGIGTFILRDQSLSPRPLYGHQGMAYGAVHMIFMDVKKKQGLISFTSGVSLARRHILADVNKALIASWQERI